MFLDAKAAFTTDSRQLQITGSGGRPVHTTMMSLGSLPTGTYTGNTTDEILIHVPGANVFGDMTVQDLGVPIRIPFTGMYIGPAPPATSPVTLTLRPGVTFKLRINAMWQAGTHNAPDLTATNTFQNNARCRQTFNGLLPPGVCPIGGGCTAN